MTDKSQQNDSKKGMEDEWVGKGYGMQGIDKAPGEETSQHDKKIVADTQKGKAKEDGDPSRPAGKPIKNE